MVVERRCFPAAVKENNMANIGLIFLAFAFVFVCLYVFGMKAIGRADVLGLILAFWIASELIGGLPRLFH